MSEGFPGGNGAPEYKGGLDEGDEVIGNTAENLRNRRLAGEAFNAFTASELDTLIADYDKEIEELEGKINEIEAERAQLERDIAATKAAESAEAAKNRVNMDKAKRNRGVQGFIHPKAARVIAGVLAALLLAGIASNFSSTNKDRSARDDEESYSDTGQQESEVPEQNAPEDTGEEAEIKSLTGYEVLDEKIDGSFLQYDNPGCYDDGSNMAVGNPDMVLELMGISPEDATAEDRGAVQEYFAYSMEEVAASVAIVYEFEGFKGLTQEEAENKIHNMTADEKAKLQDQLKIVFDATEYHYETGSGTYRNQCIKEDENGNKYSHFIESDLTGKRILVGVTTLDDGTTIQWMSKEDCGNAEDRIIVTTPNGKTTIYKIPHTETTPEKDASQQTANAGSRAEHQASTEASATSSAENIYQIGINRQSVETQKKKDDSAEEEAAKEAERQARLEAEAAKAEKKTQEADEKAKAAQEANDAKVKEEAKEREEAEKKAREEYEAKEAAKKAAEEEEERKRAEREANIEDQKLASQAAEAGADERADLFNQLFGGGSESNNP